MTPGVVGRAADMHFEPGERRDLHAALVRFPSARAPGTSCSNPEERSSSAPTAATSRARHRASCRRGIGLV